MSKRVTSFKMFNVTLPAVKGFKERKARAYLDVATGDIYGSEKITTRLHSKDVDVRESLRVVEDAARQIQTKVSPDLIKIRGKVVRVVKDATAPIDLNTGAGMKLEFQLFS